LSQEYPFAFRPVDDRFGQEGDRPARSVGGERASGVTLRLDTRPYAPLGTTQGKGPACGQSSATARPKHERSPRTREDPEQRGPSSIVPQHESQEDRLTLARQAADSGRLDQAAAICEKVLADRPTNADALCLLGLICQARGELAEAEKHFQKTLYLSPRHHDALVHMMLLAEQRGDEQAASNYRRRAARVARAGE
jgi:chemotaxis protein methyltransferase WspC